MFDTSGGQNWVLLIYQCQGDPQTASSGNEPEANWILEKLWLSPNTDPPGLDWSDAPFRLSFWQNKVSTFSHGKEHHLQPPSSFILTVPNYEKLLCTWRVRKMWTIIKRRKHKTEDNSDNNHNKRLQLKKSQLSQYKITIKKYFMR